jgi:hypothetical protein
MLFLRARDMSRSHGSFQRRRDGARGGQSSGNMARCTRISVFTRKYGSAGYSPAFSGTRGAAENPPANGMHGAAEYAPGSTGQLPGAYLARWDPCSRGGDVCRERGEADD